MPAKGHVKPARKSRIKKVRVTPELEAVIRDRAKALGLKEADWMRMVFEGSAKDTGGRSRQLTARVHEGQLAHVLNGLMLQWKRVGTNLNQMAHQANAGMVPLTRREVDYMLNLLQLLSAKSAAVLEGARP